MEVIHYILHVIGLCPEVVGLGIASTPQMLLQFFYTYLKFKFNL